MFKQAIPFFIKTITPLHAGSGQDLGIVDLPIQREKHTSYPKIEASGLKGCIRESFRTNNDAKEFVDLVFGPEKTGDHAGALGFTDARILFFPVKSAKGVFAWITCNDVLRKFEKDISLIDESFQLSIPNQDCSDGECFVASGSTLKINNESVILEEYCFKITDTEINNGLIEVLGKKTKVEKLEKKLIILSDDDFRDFVNQSTEVITRIKISSDTGTVENGQLFSEEYLPAETVLYSLVIASSLFKSDEKFEEKYKAEDESAVLKYWSQNMPRFFQVGGNETIGKGLVEFVFKEEKDSTKGGATDENN